MAAPTFSSDVDSAYNSTTSPKTASVTAGSGDILVTVAASEDSVTTLNISGGSLSYTLQGSVTAASHAEAYLWTATATGSVTTSVANSGGSRWFGQTTAVFSGSDGVGNAATSSTAQSVSVTTTQANSAILVIISDWSASDWGATRPWVTVNGQSAVELNYFRDSIRYTTGAAYWADAGAAGSKTVGLSGLTGTWSVVAIEIKGTAGGGGDATVAGEVATASAAALAATITAGSVVAGEVAGVTAQALAPTVSGGTGVTAEVATATADALAPTVTWGSTVAGEVATAIASALAPTVTWGSTVQAEVATATVDALAPTVFIGTIVTAETATATADALAPTVTAGSVVQAAVATATADALAPAVDASGSANVDAPTATATAAAQAPSVAAGASLTGAVATATATALAPSIFIDALVNAVTATATATAPAPTVSSPDWTVFAEVATANALALAPEVGATGFGHFFTTPTFDMHYSSPHEPLIVRIDFATAYSVLKENGFYRQVLTPTDEEVAAADIAYLGGRDYQLSESEYDDLVAAGYEAYITLREI